MDWILTEKLKTLESAFQWFNSCLDWSCSYGVMVKTSGGCPAAPVTQNTYTEFKSWAVLILELHYRPVLG